MSRSPLLFLVRLELVALILGGFLALSAWWWTGKPNIALAVLLGSLFSSGNLRLLVWSWSSILEDAPQKTTPLSSEEADPTPSQSLQETKAQDEQGEESALHQDTEEKEPEQQDLSATTSGVSWRHAFLATRFLFKHFFLLGGLAFCLWGLQLHVAGFSLGLGNIVIAIVLSPLLPQSTE